MRVASRKSAVEPAHSKTPGAHLIPVVALLLGPPVR